MAKGKFTILSFYDILAALIIYSLLILPKRRYVKAAENIDDPAQV